MFCANLFIFVPFDDSYMKAWGRKQMVCNVSIVASKENEKKWYLNPSSNNFQRGDWCPMRLVNVAGHYAESFYFYFF